ncbi:hypothetical protein [Amycolatopsis sp. NPDC051903]|uniref:hypothetical protein n=1 Tax=Amycolatopsis sp. NPDC051903 TaxID=3363936 RepID=UPI0037971EF0
MHDLLELRGPIYDQHLAARRTAQRALRCREGDLTGCGTDLNGNHRIHTARMLNLPWLAAAVEVEATAPAWDMLGLLAADSSRPLSKLAISARRLMTP